MVALLLRGFEPDSGLTAIANKRSRDVEKRSSTDLKLYALGPSICSQRARLIIEEKGLSYDEHTVDFSRSENLEPWYLDINPRGVVPSITENGQSLFDSYTIMLYVNNQFIGPELTPDDDAAYEKMIDYMKRADHFPVRDFAFRFSLQDDQEMDDADMWRLFMHDNVVAAREKRPELKHIYDKKIEDYNSMEKTATSEEDMAALEADCNKVMDELDAALGKHKWIVGDDFSLADISWMPIFTRLSMMGIPVYGEDMRPNINRFILQWLERPTWASAVEGHYMDMVDQMERMKVQLGKNT